MTFGSRVRELRHKMELTQRELAEKLGVSISYICKVENDNLHFGDYPSEKFVCRLADELETDVDELLLLTGRVPEYMRLRIARNPWLFKRMMLLDDDALATILNKTVTELSRGGL